jgi:hypothetical protein
MGQLWPNTIRRGLLSARPEFPYNNHAAHGRYGQILLTEDLGQNMIGNGVNGAAFIALSAVIPPLCATSERPVCRGQQAFLATSGQLGDHLLNECPRSESNRHWGPF